MICSYDLITSYLRCEFPSNVGVAKNRRFLTGRLQYNYNTFIHIFQNYYSRKTKILAAIAAIV